MTANSPSLDQWFYHEVYRWRCGAGIWWSAILTIVVSLAYVVSCYFLQLSDYFGAYFTVRVFFFIVLTAALHVTVALYNSLHYTVVPRISTTRLSTILELFHLWSVLQGIVYTVSSLLVTVFASWIMSDTFSTLAVPCTTHSAATYLNDNKLFLLTAAIYQGLLFHLRFYTNHYNYTPFQIIQQAKFFQVKSQLVPVFYQCAGQVLKQLLCFYVIFYFLGDIPRDLTSHLCRLSICPATSLSSIQSLLQPQLFLQSFLLGTFVYFTWHLAAILLKTYLTESYEFRVEAGLDHLSDKCLHNALTCNTNPWIQYLGFLDLLQLSKFSFTRRQVLFSATFPGCHPKNWNQIYQVCLQNLRRLKDATQEFNHNALFQAAIPQKNTPSWFHRENLSTGRYMKATSLGTLNHNESDTGMLSPHRENKPTKISLQTKIVEFLKKKPVFGYFLRELPDAAPRKLFSQAQIHIWTVEAMSRLVAASFTEDSLGIVQQNLPEILTVLISLYENVERHFKLTSTLGRRGMAGAYSYHDLALRQLFRSTLKSAIYRIVDAFGKCVLDFRLGHETQRRLKLFLEYKE
ncbi:nucleoporin NDC1-like [Argonauta hians]